MDLTTVVNYVIDNLYPLVASVILALVSGCLSAIVYHLKGAITIITKTIPMAMQSAERNFPNGHGDFKQDYVLNIVKNTCNTKKIKFRKRLFTFMIKLYVRISKVINNKDHVYTEEELNDEGKL